MITFWFCTLCRVLESATWLLFCYDIYICVCALCYFLEANRRTYWQKLWVSFSLGSGVKFGILLSWLLMILVIVREEYGCFVFLSQCENGEFFFYVCASVGCDIACRQFTSQTVNFIYFWVALRENLWTLKLNGEHLAYFFMDCLQRTTLRLCTIVPNSFLVICLLECLHFLRLNYTPVPWRCLTLLSLLILKTIIL